MADYNFAGINSNLSAGKYSDVLAELDKNKKSIYSGHDKVLEALDYGLLEHYSGQADSSNSTLGNAEKLIETYSAKSVSQMVGSALTNDTVKDYAGEDFENIYTNIFMALNYIQLGKTDDAMVEVRRFDNKLKLLKLNYEKTVQESDSDSEVKIKKASVKFSNSALARYLSLLLYRSQNDYDNANVDLKFINSAFESQPSLFDFKVPSSLESELNTPEGLARLNVIAFSGRAPVKVENVLRIPWKENRWYKIALPEMQKVPSKINRICVTAVNELDGKTYSTELEKLESIENIALDTFQQHYSLIFAKSLARSIARTAVNAGLDRASRSDQIQSIEGAGLLLSTFSLIHQVATEFVERADVRTSRYFPATASVCGMDVESGVYTVTVEYCSGKKVMYSQVQRIKAGEKSLNLVESACLR